MGEIGPQCLRGDAAAVAAALHGAIEGDVAWRSGRAFSLAYHAGPEVAAVADDAYRRFGGANALNTAAFPSLRRFQADVVSWVGRLVDAPAGAAGVMTSGGTESILLAVLAARQRAARDRGVARPNVVLATSAHAAFSKACHYFGLESRRLPVGTDWRAEVGAMAAAIDGNTALVVASAPQYPQGVIDPVEEIAALAARHGISCHVDACMGGMALPYLARVGRDVRPWTMALAGVTSISVDLHKFGYTAKGASVLIHRTKELRDDHTFITDDWLGGRYGSSGLLGTKGGGSIAAAWAVMQFLGDDGYLDLARRAAAACDQLTSGIRHLPGLGLVAEPDATLFAVTATDGSLDVHAVAEALWRRGWYVDRQGPPPSLHFTVNAVHDAVIAEFAADLTAAITEVRAIGAHGEAGAYGTVE